MGTCTPNVGFTSVLANSTGTKAEAQAHVFAQLGNAIIRIEALVEEQLWFQPQGQRVASMTRGIMSVAFTGSDTIASSNHDWHLIHVRFGLIRCRGAHWGTQY